MRPPPMHPAYFETRFRTPSTVWPWPDAFAIITAYAPTGQSWTESENHRADLGLRAELAELAELWRQPITGYSPTTGHAEPGWAVDLPFDVACDLGDRFEQDAIYWVRSGELFVSRCDELRALVPVGPFFERLDVAAGPGGPPPGPTR